LKVPIKLISGLIFDCEYPIKDISRKIKTT